MSGGAGPVRTTIVLGGLGALACLLSGGGDAGQVLGGPTAFGIIWCLVAVYGAALARWSGTGLTPILFPLLVLGWVGALMPRTGAACGLALAVVSWIRSGVCFPRPAIPALLREALLCGGGGLALALWAPSRPLEWALGIWLFSLVQALFFILLATAPPPSQAPPGDSFEAARRRIDDILRR